MTRLPKISPWEQKHAKDLITGKKSDDKFQDTKDEASIGSNASSASAGTRLRNKHPTRQPKETDETNLDEVINEMMEIPTRDSGASVENHTDVAASLKMNSSSTQLNKAKHTEEIDLDEVIEEILGTLGGDSKQARRSQQQYETRKKDKLEEESHGCVTWYGYLEAYCTEKHCPGYWIPGC